MANLVDGWLDQRVTVHSDPTSGVQLAAKLIIMTIWATEMVF